MSDKETITVANVSEGPGGADEEPNTPVEVPAVELLTGRGFITGKSGSGKSNTASVVIEKLLSKNFPVLIVDTDGEYYGLKEEFELLHAGADDECDIHVTPDHAEKLASLALEQNIPIILDVSSYLDEKDANKMVLEVTKHLFAKEKKLKKPFLMLVEECHEYIPEGGGMDEAGKMLIKVGKRGRKHGLGIVGISQRPADVKKDYITQCDWLVWHRLTWNNDTKVVGRILGSEYANAIEDMGNGEAFFMTDWAEDIRRVQFHKKRTFDAGATPGLDDFERPDLKSVSGDLVSELTNISDEKERKESEMADLRQELDKKRQRINELEGELEEAQDMSQMADTFAQALLQKAEAPYRQGGQTRPPRPEMADDESEWYANDAAREGHPATPSPVPDARDDVREKLDARADGEDVPDEAANGGRAITDDQSELHDYEEGANDDSDPGAEAEIETPDTTGGDGVTDEDTLVVEAASGPEPVTTVEDGEEPETAAEDADADHPRPVRVVAAGGGETAVEADEVDDDAESDVEPDPESAGAAGSHAGETRNDPASADEKSFGIVPQANPPSDDTDDETTVAEYVSEAGHEGNDAGHEGDDESAPIDSMEAVSDVDRLTAFVDGVELRETEAVVEGFVRAIEQFDEVTRGMLARYCTANISSPIDAHVFAGGSGDRHWAYARNRTLRQAGLVEHVSHGRYEYCLPDLVGEVFADGVDGQTLADTVATIEREAGLREE
jgi:hypothetical protein